MKKLVLFVLLIAVTSSAFPRTRNDPNQQQYLSTTENETQSKRDEMQLRLDQSFFERQLELEEQQAAAQEAADAAQEAAEAAQEAADAARQEAKELAEKAKQEAEDRASELENRERISAASNRNLIYEAFALMLSGLSFYKIGKDKRQHEENILNAKEKAGVVVATTGVMCFLVALFVSRNWVSQLDILQNLMQNEFMSVMYLDFWPHAIRTRYVALLSIALIFYGAMIYFEILRAPKFLLSKFGG